MQITYTEAIRVVADFGNAESTIPLSPQWLLPKSGEIKPAAPSSVWCSVFVPSVHVVLII